MRKTVQAPITTIAVSDFLTEYELPPILPAHDAGDLRCAWCELTRGYATTPHRRMPTVLHRGEVAPVFCRLCGQAQ